MWWEVYIGFRMHNPPCNNICHNCFHGITLAQNLEIVFLPLCFFRIIQLSCWITISWTRAEKLCFTILNLFYIILAGSRFGFARNKFFICWVCMFIHSFVWFIRIVPVEHLKGLNNLTWFIFSILTHFLFTCNYLILHFINRYFS